MAKKFVRGVTGIEDIESYDKTLTNVNDILSDGQDTFVHTKKGKTESYYKLTDSLKSVISDNSELITVTKDDTTNTATLHPKHDTQKEQSIESTRGTVTIQKGTNGTSETTKLDTNPQKVLEHENLTVSGGLVKSHVNGQNATNLSVDLNSIQAKMTASDGVIIDNNVIKLSALDNYGGDLNKVTYNTIGKPSPSATNMPPGSEPYGILVVYKIGNVITQLYYNYSNTKCYVRAANVSWNYEKWNDWVSLQNTLSSNNSIGVLSNNQLTQLFSLKQTYTHANGLLKTFVKNLAENTTVNTAIEEFNFTVKINQNAANIVVTLNTHDTTAFTKIMTKYGSNNTVRISGCVFTLSGSTLTVTTTNNTAQNYVMTFSDILD